MLRIKQDLNINVKPTGAFFDGPTPKGEPIILTKPKDKSVAAPLQADVLMAFNNRQDSLQQAAAASGGGVNRVILHL